MHVRLLKKTSIKLNKSKATIYIFGNKTVQLKATVKGSNKKVVWESSNKKIATVNSNGKVTAKKAGTVTIIAKANKVRAKCLIEIKRNNITPKRGISLRQAKRALVKYLSDTKFYISSSRKIGSKYIIWVSYTGPGTKGKYGINPRNGKAYCYAPYWGVDISFSENSVHKQYQFNVYDYI